MFHHYSTCHMILANVCVYEFVSVLLHLFICSFGSIYKWNHDIFFIWLIPFSIIPSRSFSIVTNGKILHFYGWVMFHRIYICHLLFIYSLFHGHLGCFHILAIVNNAAPNIGVHVFFDVVFSYSLDKYTKLRLLSE